MARRRNNIPRYNGGNGHPGNGEMLKLLGQLVKGQAKLVEAVAGIKRELRETRRELAQLRRDHDRGFRMLFKVAMDSHREIQILKKDVSTLKSDVSNLNTRMTRVERRIGGNGSGGNGHRPAR